MACCGNSGKYEKNHLKLFKLGTAEAFFKFVQVVITRELNNVAGKPSDRASSWT